MQMGEPIKKKKNANGGQMQTREWILILFETKALVPC